MPVRFLILALLAGCATTKTPDIWIATDATFPPFHYVDEDGDITGYDVAVATVALDRARISSGIVRVETYRQLFEGLEAGTHCD